MDTVRNPASAAFLAVCIGWVVLLFSAPAALPADSVHGLDGAANRVDNAPEYSGMNPVSNYAYLLGDYNCHQIEARTLEINGNEMPMCARDVGIFIGAAAGFALAVLVPARPSLRDTLAAMVYRGRAVPALPGRTGLLALFVLLAVLPVGLDGGIQLMTSYESTNATRLATGAVSGAAGTLLLGLYINTASAHAGRPEGG